MGEHPLDQLMAQFTTGLDRLLNGDGSPKFGFMLMIFELDQTSRTKVEYATNADREAMLVAMKAWIAQEEGRLRDAGHA